MDNKEAEFEDSTDKLLNDLKDVVQDGEELLRAKAADMSDQGMAARAKLQAALESAKATGRRLEERAAASAEAADRAIREHPYQSIGVAFGIGLLIGVLINRR